MPNERGPVGGAGELTALGERFWENVDRAGPVPKHKAALGACWLWLGRTSEKEKPYGRFRVDGVDRQAHRVSYSLLIGPVPRGKVLDHLCRNHRCVNPQHLEPVTDKENILRGEGWGAKNARKTHCAKGHPLSGANLVHSSNSIRKSWRACRICRRNAEAINRWRVKNGKA